MSKDEPRMVQPQEHAPTPAPDLAASPGHPHDGSDALDALIRAEAQPAYRLAMSIVQDAALAEDVVQESFVRAWLALPSWRGDAPMRHWLLRIVHNTAVSTLRTVRDTQTDPDVLDRLPSNLELSEHVENLVTIDALWKALAELDDLSRAVVVLRELEGLSYEEICDILDTRMPTVKTRLFRARSVLAAALAETRAA